MLAPRICEKKAEDFGGECLPGRGGDPGAWHLSYLQASAHLWPLLVSS